MPLTIKAWEEAKARTFEAAKLDAANRATLAGLGGKDRESLVRAVEPPLVAFFDETHAHFVGEDCDHLPFPQSQSPCEPVGDKRHVRVDRRLWNVILGELNDNGHEVHHLDIDG